MCWGSFLNVFAYRIIQDQSLLGRSRCPRCNSKIAWYDNIPLISWLALGGKCRSCAKPISVLYPAIELAAAILFTLLYLKTPVNYLPAHFLLFSALIVTIRTDFETMLISRFVSLYLIPVGWLCAALGLLPTSLSESLLSSIGGFVFLWLFSQLFQIITKKQGIGEGDIELLAFIGAFTGLLGLWSALMVGSILGSVCGITYLLLTGGLRAAVRIPFGPFLALGTISYVLWLQPVVHLLYC